MSLQQDALTLEGVSVIKARTILNARLDQTLAAYKQVQRHQGDRPAYEARLAFQGIDSTLLGVDVCRHVILESIDALESA